MGWNEQPAEWLTKVPIVMDRRALETLEEGGPRALDSFLLIEISQLKREYNQTGDPRVIYLAGSAVASTVESMKGAQESYQFSRLQAFLAEMLLAQGKNVGSLRIAEQHLEVALETIRRIQVVSNEVIRAYVSYALLLGIVRKVLGRFDDSLRSMRAIARELSWRNGATACDLIPLARQEIIMQQTVDGHRELAEKAVHYRLARPREYYRSLKRVFEYLLNKGGVREAEQIYPEFRRAFVAMDPTRISPIACVSYMKNVGQYLMAQRDPDARSVLENVSKEARLRNLHGQARQVGSLIQELESGSNMGRLMTFILN